jgi:hypothetical protein
MSTRTDRKLTGSRALLTGALSLVMIPLYFVHAGPPPAGNVLVRNLLTVVIFTAFLVFVTGTRRMLAPVPAWPVTSPRCRASCTPR